VHQYHLWRHHGAKARVKALVKKVFRKFFLFVIRRPGLKSFAFRISHRLGMTNWLKPLVRNLLLIQSPHIEIKLGSIYELYKNPDFLDLSPRARQIYTCLKEAVSQHEKKTK
jgi:hypothetical protein